MILFEETKSQNDLGPGDGTGILKTSFASHIMVDVSYEKMNKDPKR